MDGSTQALRSLATLAAVFFEHTEMCCARLCEPPGLETAKMPSVAIFGGGVGGLTTAHELVERGFDVEVFDVKPDVWGGKARSQMKSASGAGGRQDLPGEHGFRFFPGFYKHLPDTMSRIPFPGNAKGVLDNLVATTECALYRENGAPYTVHVNFPQNIEDWRNAIKEGLAANSGIGKGNLDFFVEQVLHLACSCQQRLDYEYDSVAWWDFVDAANRGDDYQKILAQGLTRSLVAVQARESSTRTVGTMLLQMIYTTFTPGGQSDRVLNGPTNDQWIDPWITYLAGKRVALNLNSQVVAFNMNGSKLGSVTVNVNGVARNVTADFYVSAIPVEKMAGLLNEEMIVAAPDLTKIKRFKTDWMNGIQFYLSTDVPVIHGHVIYLDSKWAITSVSQHQFWDGVDLSKYGDGNVRGILSVDISDWHDKGDQVVFKPAAGRLQRRRDSRQNPGPSSRPTFMSRFRTPTWSIGILIRISVGAASGRRVTPTRSRSSLTLSAHCSTGPRRQRRSPI